MMNYLMKRGFLLLVVFLLASCNKKIIQVKNEGYVATDSTLLCRQESTIKIYIGNRLIPNPLSSQIVEVKNDSATTYYVILDENTLYWFDVTTGNLLKSQMIKGCGTLNNYSGFLCRNDTTFVYNYKQKVVYMLDSEFDIKKSWKITNSDMLEGSLDPEALTDSPILYSHGRIMLSGTKLGQQKDDTVDKHPISCCINISDDEFVCGGNYPEQYMNGDFGGVYFNTIYHTLGDSDNLLYSFPTDHYVYSYSLDFSGTQKKYMGSRYTSAINSSDYNSLELFKDKDLRIKYFVSQHSYSNILYDRYRKVYYRIAQHPLVGWESGSFRKPFSIIVMDVEGNLISETPIQDDYKDLNLHNMHVTKEGLLIQKRTLNENIIEFVLYTMVDDEK